MTTRKKPTPGKGKWGVGWYECKHALITGGFSVVSGLSAVATTDNIKAIFSQPGAVATLVGILLGIVRFVGLIHGDNSAKKT